MMKPKKEDRVVKKLRRVIKMTNPEKLKLSPETARRILRNADPEEIEVVELDGEDETKTKHIAFRGVPIYLCIKLSHRQHRLNMIGERS
ncbi:MAG: hypothetical protein ACMUIE_07745 [Thermoplasmatota archaeon]